MFYRAPLYRSLLLSTLFLSMLFIACLLPRSSATLYAQSVPNVSPDGTTPDGAQIVASITGRVTNVRGEPLEGITVFVENLHFTGEDVFYTDANGNYEISHLPTGIYYLIFSDLPYPDFFSFSGNASEYATSYYGGIVHEEAIPISVTGSDVTGIDMTLPQSGEIVVELTAVPELIVESAPVNLDIWLFYQINGVWEIVDWIDSDFMPAPDGAAQQINLINIAPADYHICIELYNFIANLRVEECYDNALRVEEGRTLSVLSGETTTIAMELGQNSFYGAISGRVTSESGEPLMGITVRAEGANEASVMSIETTTAEDGSYTLAPIEPNVYAIRFEDQRSTQTLDDSLNFLSKFYDEEIVLDPNEEVSGVDVVMTESGTIGGTITVEDTLVDNTTIVELYSVDDLLYTIDRYQFRVENRTANYSFSYIAPGEYYVRLVTRPFKLYYPSAAIIDDATRIKIGAGEVLDDVDFVKIDNLPEYGQITGQVTTQNGESVPYARVSYYRVRTVDGKDAPVSVAVADEQGRYRVPTVEPGRYKLCVDGVQYSSNVHEVLHETCYGNTSYVEDATTIPIDVGELVSGINISAEERTHIRGRVRTAGDVPFSGSIKLFKLESELSDMWWSIVDDYYVGLDADRPTGDRYMFVDPVPGIYRMSANIYSVYGTQIQYYPKAASIESSTDIEIVEGQSIALDWSIYDPLDARIAGRATRDGEPLAGIRVDLYDYYVDDYSQLTPFVFTTTDNDGRFVVDGLAPAPYYVRFSDPDGELTPIYYGGLFAQSAQVIELSDGQVRDDIDVEMAIYQDVYLPTVAR